MTFRRGALSALVFLAIACVPEPVGPGVESAQLFVTANVSQTSVTQLVITVSAADIPVPLVFNLTASGGTASGTLLLPPGQARGIVVQAFDATGLVTHDGGDTVDVVAGPNPPLTIVLLPRGGQQPIVVVIGSITIQVTPGVAGANVSSTVQLTAQILGPGNVPVSGPVVWASTNPAIASVSSSGLVTALRSGTVLIVATAYGSAGTSSFTSTGGVALNETDVPAEADFCVLQFPPTVTTQAGVPVAYFGRLFESGLTPAGGLVPSIRAMVGYGPLGTDPRTAAGWVFVPATYNTAVSNDDEYAANIATTFVGTYSTVVRFSIDGGAGWTYCDVDGAGSNPGLTFSTVQLGTLTVTP